MLFRTVVLSHFAHATIVCLVRRQIGEKAAASQVPSGQRHKLVHGRAGGAHCPIGQLRAWASPNGHALQQLVIWSIHCQHSLPHEDMRTRW